MIAIFNTCDSVYDDLEEMERNYEEMRASSREADREFYRYMALLDSLDPEATAVTDRLVTEREQRWQDFILPPSVEH